MARLRVPRWTGRALLLFAVAMVSFVAAAAWISSNAIRADMLVPRSQTESAGVDVLTVGGGRIILARDGFTEQQGTFGVETADAYGQVGPITRMTDIEVERTYVPLLGEVDATAEARWDIDSFPGDPLQAHGYPFEEVRVPGDLGANPGWLIEGRRSTWVVIAHDEGTDRLGESLRIIPSLVEEGYPVLVTSYRDDGGAPPSRSGLRSWGLDEWQDLDAALTLAERKGAETFVLIGTGFGAQVVAALLHESDWVDSIAAVVFDSPVLDPEKAAAGHGVGTPISWLGRELVRIRFGLEWDTLDQVARADQFDVPVLILHGDRDVRAPIEVSEAFVAARSDIARLERFVRAGHGALWNADPVRYEATLLSFLAEVGDPA